MSWRTVKLGEILKVRDNRFKPNDNAISNLKRIDKIDFSGEIFISDKPSNTDMILIKKGDLVISGINVEKGAMAVYTGENDITATIHYSSYNFDINKIDIDFLKYFLKSLEFKKALKEQVPGGIKTEIKPKHLLPLLVNIPTDIKDQRELVNLLQNRNSKVDSISSELTHQLSLVKKLRQQLLQDAVQGKLVEQNEKDEPASELLKKIKAEKEKLIAGKKIKKEKELPPIKAEEIPFEIPENWVWCRLGNLTSLITSGSRNWNKYYSAEGALFIRSQNIMRTEIDLAKKAFVHLPNSTEGKRTSVILNDILITITGAGVSNSGRLEKIDFKEAYVSQHVALIRLISDSISKWVHYCIISECVGKKQFSALIYGDKPGLNLTQINLLMIPLPPFSAQKIIIKKIDELMKQCNNIEESIKQCESENEKLLQQVLREALRKESVDA